MNKISAARASLFETTALAVVLAWGVPGCGDSTTSDPKTGPLTFWQDVAPIYDQKCVRCHQSGGIAPFALDNFTDAKAHAADAKAETQAGTMPPFFEVHDGSCGQFHDEDALTATEKATIAAWADGDRKEGTPVTLTPPAQDHLADATTIETPLFTPRAQGTALAAHDEYRCFLVDQPSGAATYLTGYEVRPGTPAIIHHVLGFVVDPAQRTASGKTNAAVLEALHSGAVAAEGSERAGWPCFGGAGDGVDATGVPITWGPGQGVVRYPEGMGVPLGAGLRFVLQVHYNLEDPAAAGLSDETTIVLHYERDADRALAFALPDAFLDSLNKATPDSLPPMKADASYTWTTKLSQEGLDGTTGAELVGIMPHMHGRGLRQTVKIGPAPNLACVSHLENWDFHWQRMYLYKNPVPLHAQDSMQVTCAYDTSADESPVLPGWGTSNEMCLAVMMIALPAR